MKSILYSELGSDFLVQGFGLHKEEHGSYIGKLGRHEMEIASSLDSLETQEAQIIYFGDADPGPYRDGDILMAGSDELLDRAFRALDEMEQRGVVVGLSSGTESHQLCLHKEKLKQLTQHWKEKKVPFICLFMRKPVDLEGQAKLVTIARKVLSD